MQYQKRYGIQNFIHQSQEISIIQKLDTKVLAKIIDIVGLEDAGCIVPFIST